MAPTTEGPGEHRAPGQRPVAVALHGNSNASFRGEVEWNIRFAKLHMDFQATTRLCRDMSDCNRDLIVQLCTRVGIAMEDMSIIALQMGPLPAEELDSTIDALEKSVGQMLALIIAARSLNE